MNVYDLSSRTALVTGGASGIGRAACERLLEAGARVAAFDVRVGTGADLSIVGDVTSSDDVDAAVERVRRELGPIDVVVCAAGVGGTATPTAELSDEAWEQVLDVNATGTLRVLRATIPGMVERGYGRIVTLASIAAWEGLGDRDAYAASKAAVVSVTRTVGRSLATTGVLVNCVVPALIDTELIEQLSPEQRATVLARIPMGRPGRPEEVATLIAFLCTEDLSFSTGACFDATGGRANY